MEENTQQQVQHLGDLIINCGNELKRVGMELEKVHIAFEEGKELDYKEISETLKHIYEVGDKKKYELKLYINSFWDATLMLTTYSDILKTTPKEIELPQPRLDFPIDIAETIKSSEGLLSECFSEWFYGHLFGMDIEKEIKYIFEHEKGYCRDLNMEIKDYKHIKKLKNMDSSEALKELSDLDLGKRTSKKMKRILKDVDKNREKIQIPSENINDDDNDKLALSVIQNMEALYKGSKDTVDEFKTKIKSCYENLKNYGNVLAEQGGNLKGKIAGFDELKETISQYAQLLNNPDFAKQRFFMAQADDSNIYPVITEVSYGGRVHFIETELPLLQCNFKINTEISIPKEELVYIAGPYNLGKDKELNYPKHDLNQHLAPHGGGNPSGYMNFVVLKTLIEMTKENPNKIFLIGPTIGGDSCRAYLPVVEFKLRDYKSIEDYLQEQKTNKEKIPTVMLCIG